MKRAGKHNDSRDRARRQRVAYEAARLIAIHGLQDYQQAKLKAAQQLGLLDEASLPRNAEIQAQLRDYQRLFQARDQPAQLQLRRQAALQAMQFFERFQPRLVGSVLDGTADANSPISLQLFCDDAEAIARFLLDAQIPASMLADRKLRLGRERVAGFSAWGFAVDGLAFEVIVLPEAMLRQPPLSAIDAEPMQRASATALRRLLAEYPEPGSDLP